MNAELKEWMTAGEIAKLRVPGFPHSQGGVHYFARSKGINLDPSLCRGRKGTSGVEYHRSIVQPAFDDHLNWLTAEEIRDLKIPDLPTRIDELQAKFRKDGIEENPVLFRRNGQGRASLYHRSVIEDRDNWFSASEIVGMNLPGLPTGRRHIIAYMKKNGAFDNPALARQRSGQGGGFEYHLDSLPEIAKERRKALRRNKQIGPSIRN